MKSLPETFPLINIVFGNVSDDLVEQFVKSVLMSMYIYTQSTNY